MAEFVSQSRNRLCRDLTNIKSLSLKEKRKIVRKCEQLEYRIHKRVKHIEDFESYIEYEKNLYDLLKLRNASAYNRKALIPFIKKIHELYQNIQAKFPENLSGWLQHIYFTKQQGDRTRVARIYRQMLGYHGDKAEIWVQAAFWEIRCASICNARKLMQRCVQLNKTSCFAWVEFFKMELRITKLEAEPNCELAQLVSEAALEELPENQDLVISFYEVCLKFKFASSLKQRLLEKLQQEFPNEASTWDILARQCIPRQNRKGEIWTCYLNTCLELIAIPDLPEERLQKILLLRGCGRIEEAIHVSCQMTERYPQSNQSWLCCLRTKIQVSSSSTADITSCLDQAVQSVCAKDAWILWELVLQYLAITDDDCLEQMIESACRQRNADVAEPAKLWYLNWISLSRRTMKDVRSIYRRLSALKPVPAALYCNYALLELMQENVKMDNVRQAYEEAVLEHGTSDPEVWLDYICAELSQHGDAVKGGMIQSRALLHLPEGPLREKFVQRYRTLSNM